MAQPTIEQALELAIQHHQAGRLAEAEPLYRQILQESPNDPEATYLLGLVSGQLGRYELATDLIRKAIDLLPPDAEMYNNLGEFYRRWGKTGDAIAAYQQALALNANSPEAHSNLGIAWMDSGNLDQAIAALRRAIALKPGLAEAHNNLGNALRNRGQLDEAIAAYRQAMVLNPRHAKVCGNLGGVLSSRGQLDEAIAAYRQALTLEPNDPETHLNLAFALLAKGDFAQGWEEHEWRWQCKEFFNLPQNLSQRKWDGSPLQGRTLLLHTEQGLGDTIHFVRFVPLAARHGGRVVLRCQEKLLPLLKHVEGVAQIVAYQDALPEFDVHCPLLSLPKVLGTTLETIPASVPYLFAAEASVENWRRELAGIPGFKVGIAWRGNPKNALDAKRSISLAHFEPLSRIAGVTLISLQKGPGTDEIAELAGQVPVMDLGERLDGAAGPFMDTPAVMMNLDLVITVDTVTCHLAGALGVPVWTLLPHAADWRWLRDRPDTPWYPTMRLFRQQANGDWDSVLQQVAAALARLPR